MVRPRGIPQGLDAATTQRIARRFLVVRIVRSSLLLLFLAIALTALMRTVALAASCRRYAWSDSHSHRGAAR
jgi:hypothetical protein